jgi:alpha-L-fucosidase
MTVPETGAQLKIASFSTGGVAVPTPIKAVTLLGSDAKLTWVQQADGLVITCPDTSKFKSAIGFRVSYAAN